MEEIHQWQTPAARKKRLLARRVQKMRTKTWNIPLTQRLLRHLLWLLPAL
jgi:hypothetical protein